MNKKAQFDFEFNPLYLAGGVVVAIVTEIVMANSNIGMFWKFLGFIFGIVAGYVMMSIVFR